MMSSAEDFKTSVTITENSPKECCHHDFPHTDNQTIRSQLFKMIQKFQVNFLENRNNSNPSLSLASSKFSSYRFTFKEYWQLFFLKIGFIDCK